MNNDPRNIMPGDRVRVFNSRVYKDDITTSLSMTMQLATVVSRYGKKSEYHFDCVHDPCVYDFGVVCKPTIHLYPDLVDVKFDNDERISCGHFTNGVELV